MPLILALACAKAPIELGPPIETMQQFKLESPFGTLGGMAVVVLDDDFVLQALSPAGTAIFTVTDEGVSAPDEGWAAALERIPFERDMLLVYRWSCPTGRCSTETGGKVTQTTETDDEATWVERSYRGPSGPATVRIRDGKAVLEDGRRRYTLTVISEEIRAR